MLGQVISHHPGCTFFLSLITYPKCWYPQNGLANTHWKHFIVWGSDEWFSCYEPKPLTFCIGRLSYIYGVHEVICFFGLKFLLLAPHTCQWCFLKAYNMHKQLQFTEFKYSIWFQFHGPYTMCRLPRADILRWRHERGERWYMDIYSYIEPFAPGNSLYMYIEVTCLILGHLEEV